MTPFNYTPYYCEENAWHLAGHDSLPQGRRWVVWISNPTKSCALWAQKASPDPTMPVVWDYHVLVIAEDFALSPNERVRVFDLDTTLGWALPLTHYLAGTFPAPDRLPDRFQPLFRVVPADEFRTIFRSDRSHMKDHDGQWLQPPPPWPRIDPPTGSLTIAQATDMSRPEPGEVVGLDELRSLFRK